MNPNPIEKEKAIRLRKKGKSIRDIEKTLGIRRSTLSGWLHNIELSESQKQRLHKEWLNALVKARFWAAQSHRNERLKRVGKIKEGVKGFVSGITINKTLGEIIFAIFYLAEGTKKENAMVVANSNPNVLKSFLNLFRYLYKPEESKFRCCLHLRGDQSEKQLKDFWSQLLSVPESQFNKTQFDKRTIKTTFRDYQGVCVITYFDMDLQRRILYLGESLIQKMITI